MSESDGDTPQITEEEWAHRTLCSDGNCIGVIGPDGLCKECGKPLEGPEPDETGIREDDVTDSQIPDPEEVPEAEFPEQPPVVEADDDDDDTVPISDDWETRRLCSDGNCIGVIGPNGLCKECGKPYEE